MPSLQIKYNRRSVAAQFDRFEREYPARVISEVMKPWSKEVIQSAKRTRSFKDRSGNLRRGLGARVIRARALEIQFTYGVPYGAFVDQGTRARPGNKGIRARDFWRAAIRRNRSKLGPMLERETRRQADRAGL